MANSRVVVFLELCLCSGHCYLMYEVLLRRWVQSAEMVGQVSSSVFWTLMNRWMLEMSRTFVKTPLSNRERVEAS